MNLIYANNEDNQVNFESASIAEALTAVIKLQGGVIDRARLFEVLKANSDEIQIFTNKRNLKLVEDSDWQSLLTHVIQSCELGEYEVFDKPDHISLPLITWLPDRGWAIIRAQSANDAWVIEVNGKYFEFPRNNFIPCVGIAKKAIQNRDEDNLVFNLFKEEFTSNKEHIIDASISTIVINLLGFLVSFYSMQVYDRVIPNQGYSTLLVLTIGVGLALAFDLILKIARGHVLDEIQKAMDKNISRHIFSRLLNIRLDQMPRSVGSLAGQIRGYEAVRGFLSNSTLYVLVDVPFGIVSFLAISFIATPMLAIIPLFFGFVAYAFGMASRSRLDGFVAESTASGHQKTGLLVEALEGAETIKAGGGGWLILSKWLSATESGLRSDIAIKKIGEYGLNFSSLFQQLSYILLICLGAYLAAEGSLTTGALVATTILSGRILSPIGRLPSMIIEYAQARNALSSLESIFKLELDNHNVINPLAPQNLSGNYELNQVTYAYGRSPTSLKISSLSIKAGEKIGVIGPIGSGKSTLLRILSGMYQVTTGQVRLDGLDIDQISKQPLSESIGFLQQEHRLISGTLRENLLIGTPDPGDDVIKSAAEKTGLLELISNHPRGLDLEIAEGGKGLSGGQKQLVALTRLLIQKPKIFLLDEPMASLDAATEEKCSETLFSGLKDSDTLLLVTHKTQLLSMVDRIIVVGSHQILLDGSRDEVVAKLSQLSVK